MRKHLFNIAATVSSIAFCLLVVAWLTASSVDPRKQFVSLSTGCHLSVDARGADARLKVFNDASYGPYSGSIIGITGDANGAKVSGIGDGAGIYYRMIRWPTGAKLWTLSLSLGYPLVLSALLPTVWLMRRSRRRGRGFPVEGQSAAG